MSSHEIEDVLSSIRRLVSEDLRPAAQRQAAVATGAALAGAAPAAVTAATGPMPGPLTGPVTRPATGRGAGPGDKLILTPALRIVGQEDAPGHDDDGDAGAAAETAMLARLAAADPAPPLSLAPDAALPVSDVPEAPFADLTGDGDAAMSLDHVEAVLNVSADVIEWQDDIWSAARRTAAATAEAAHDEPAEDTPDLMPSEPAAATAAQGDDADDPAPMWTGVDQVEVWGEPGPDWVEEEPLSFTPHRRAAAVPPTTAAEPLATAWADRAEAAVRAELDQEAPVMPQAQERTAQHAAQEPAAQPHVRPAATARPAAYPAPDSDTDHDLFAEETGPIDEETLRAIVRDIIREELAGTLGERITRNVRKLVRVEINRALASRDFE